MTKTAPYLVSRRMGDIKIRSYPVHLLATVSGLSDDAMFMVLFRYISGNNHAKMKIAMIHAVFWY